jgi:hypothetical protein
MLSSRERTEALRLLLRPREAAEALAISPRTLWELTKRGELVPIRVSGHGKARALRYLVSDLERWTHAQKTPPTDRAVS